MLETQGFFLLFLVNSLEKEMLSAEFVVGMKNMVLFVLVTFASCCCCCCRSVLFLGCKLVCDSLILCWSL